jgi:aldose 1-epimerase
MVLIDSDSKMFGVTGDGKQIEQYALSNKNGMVAKFITYGATLTELHVPDRHGQTSNVVLGFDNLQQYLGEHPWFGSTIGRVANRIAGGRFTLNGITYRLTQNDGANTLHGGMRGFDKQIWQAELSGSNSIKFSYLSKHLDEGFPGNVNVTVSYSLTEDNELIIDYTANTDQPTPLNLTHHSYFNLAGAGCGNICDHLLQIAASRHTVMNDNLIPTGEIAAIANTPLDFKNPTQPGSRIPNIIDGYDLNYALDSADGCLKFAARLVHPDANRSMEVWTTQPGLQLYTANSFDGTISGIGGKYGQYAGIALETQHFPDSVNHPHFPNTILEPNATYRQTTIYKFSW